jgi:hypothetical protein
MPNAEDLVKNCIACATELPDSAVHCGACGKKQPPAPMAIPTISKGSDKATSALPGIAVPPANNGAMTQMGYSADELKAHLKAGASSPQGQNQPTPVAPVVAPRANALTDVRAPHDALTIGPDAGFAPYVPPARLDSERQVTSPVAPADHGAKSPVFASTAPLVPSSAPTMVAQAYVMTPAIAANAAPPARDPRMASTIIEQIDPSSLPTIAPQSQLQPQLQQQSPFAPVVSPAAFAATAVPVASSQEPSGSVPLTPAVFQAQVFQPQSNATPLDQPIAARLSLSVGDDLRSPYSAVCLVMGIVSLLYWLIPPSISPMRFSWEALGGNGPMTFKFISLFPAIIGVVGILLAIVPAPTVARGIIGALLCIGAIVAPLTVDADMNLDWVLKIGGLVGPIVVIAGLIYRDAFRSSMLGRIVTVIGALISVAVVVIPRNDSMPLVEMFRGLVGDGGDKMQTFFALVPVVLIILAVFLVWIPSPSAAGAKSIAWLLILWVLAATVSKLIAVGHIADVVKSTPSAFLAWAPVAAIFAIGGYGLAAAFGKGSSN